MLQANPDALTLNGVDEEEEGKMDRKRKRIEAFENQREKERRRVAEEKAVHDFSLSDDDDDDDEGEMDDSDDDDDYHPGRFGHERKRARIINLSFDVDKFRSSYSARADRHGMSSRTRSDDLSNFVVEGGGNLFDVPSSQSAMIRFANYE